MTFRHLQLKINDSAMDNVHWTWPECINTRTNVDNRTGVQGKS